MFRSMFLALPFVVSLVACGGATEPSGSAEPARSETNPPSSTSTPTTTTGTDTAKDAPKDETGAAPSSLSSTFALEGMTLNGIRRKQDTCGQGSATYTIDLAKRHATIVRCSAGATDEDAWTNKTTLDRDLTTEEHAAIEKQFVELQDRPLPSSCGYDGYARTLKVGTIAYLDQDYNCNGRGDVRYVDYLRPLAQTIATLDGSSEPM